MLLANPQALELTDSGISEGRTQVAVGVDGTILGFATGLALEGLVLELEDLFIDPEWMRRGIARRLVAKLTEMARRDGITRISVTANPHADTFYRRVGFAPVHATQTELGPGVRMELVVPRRGDEVAQHVS